MYHILKQPKFTFAVQNEVEQLKESVMKAKKLFFKECNLAGRQYHDVDEVWEELHVGTQLKLQRDLDNRYDKNAVAVVYNNVDVETGIVEDYLLGYIPSEDNETIAQLLEMGWDDIFECRISKINPDAHYENQIRLTIRIVKNDNKK